MAGIARFLKELRRRDVAKVAIAYVAIAWLLVEVSSTIFPIFETPTWILRNFVYLVVAGFPIALIFAWIYELTPDGVKRTSEVLPDRAAHAVRDSRFNIFVISVLVIALSYFIIDEFFVEPASRVASVDELSKRSIAVIPFVNRSIKTEDEFFVDGIHDDILTQLAHIGSLQVISRTSVMDYRGTTKSIKTIGKELGVGTILEGGVQRAGDHVRINMQLIDAATDKHLWAQTYDRELTAANIFAIQTEIATTVARALQVTLTENEQHRLGSIPTENLEAYESYMLGKHEFAKRTTDAFEVAIPHFQRAIDLDPDFALAYVGLGLAYALLDGWTSGERIELRGKAESALQKALELDDQLGEAYAVLGMRAITSDNFESAESYFERAMTLAPNYSDGRNWYAGIFFRQGRIDEGIAQLEIAVRLDPRNWPANGNLAQAYAMQGRTDKALSLLDKLVKTNPNEMWPYIELAIIYGSYLGQLDDTVIATRKILRSNPDNSYPMSELALLYLDLGDDASAENWIERAVSIDPESELTIDTQIALYLYRNNTEQAAQLAQKAIASDPDLGSVFLLRALRDHAMKSGRYQDARDLYASREPSLFTEPNPHVDGSNIGSAIDLVPVLRHTGESDRADMLLQVGLNNLQDALRLGRAQRVGREGYGFADVQIYALQGKTDLALMALREVVDQGWRESWWYYADQDPALASIRDAPEFQALMDEIRQDMATQLARLNEHDADATTLTLD